MLVDQYDYRWNDLYFLKQVMPAVVNLMREEATLVTLVKPQFEARRSQVKALTCPFFFFFFSLSS